MKNIEPYPPPKLAEKAHRALEATDDMPSQYRLLVHEFGTEIVNEFRQCGVSDPRKILRLVVASWNGARNLSNRTGKNTKVSAPVATLDWLMIQAGAQISAMTLLAMLHKNGWAVAPYTASAAMIRASMSVDLTDRVVSKHEKHQARLRAAMNAASRELWPHLWDGRH